MDPAHFRNEWFNRSGYPVIGVTAISQVVGVMNLHLADLDPGMWLIVTIG